MPKMKTKSSAKKRFRFTANGKIMLINPNGILFGAGARVDVGGLVASTTNIRNDDFLNGKYKFSEPSTHRPYGVC